MSLTGVERKALNRQIRNRREAKPRLTLVPMQAKQEKTRTGLEWLLHKQQISPTECKAGLRFGKDYRQAQVSGLEPIKSCIGGDIGRTAGSRTLASHADHNYAADLNVQLAARYLQDTLDDPQGELLTAIVQICGRQLTPREIEPEQRKSERLTNTLRIALRLLVRHYAGQDRQQAERRPAQ